MAEILFFTGKGGVGKTTISALTAIERSSKGNKVLLTSIDPAHSLSDIFEMAKSEKINLENIDHVEIDIHKETEKYIRNALDTISKFISGDTFSKVKNIVESLAFSPGAEDAVLLEVISRLIFQEKKNYDVLIFDTAPSGHTIRFLKDMYNSGRLLEHIYEEAKTIFHFKKISGVNTGSVDIPSLIKDRTERIKGLWNLIKERKIEFIVVMNPDFLSFQETKRLINELENSEIYIKAIFINKIFTDEFPVEYVKEQRYIIKRIEECFNSYRLIKVGYFDGKRLLRYKLDL